jgi:hypothetical protein
VQPAPAPVPRPAPAVPPVQAQVEPPVQRVPAAAPAPRPAPAGAAGDPPNFAELVASLTEIGFEQRQCEQALRIANYNAESAANLLLAGEVPAAGAAAPAGGAGAGGY